MWHCIQVCRLITYVKNTMDITIKMLATIIWMVLMTSAFPKGGTIISIILRCMGGIILIILRRLAGPAKHAALDQVDSGMGMK